jgi:sulfur-oxidizing protein SoxX
MKVVKRLLIATAISALVVTSGTAAGNAENGKKIFNDKNLGNCLACHNVNGEAIDGPGSLGPQLQYMSAWPEEALFAKVYGKEDVVTAMPAFGRNGWLTDSEINDVVAFLKTVN